MSKQATKRPFRKLVGVNPQNDAHAIKHNRRPFVFNMVTSDGGAIQSQGNIRPEDCPRAVELLMELQQLHKKGQPS